MKLMTEPTNQEIMALLQTVAADVADLYRDMVRIETWYESRHGYANSP